MNLDFKRNRKGNAILDTLTIMIVVFAFILVTVFGRQVLGDFNDSFQQTDVPQVGKDTVQQVDDYYPGLFDSAFLLFVILFWIAALILSFLTDSHPVFFVLTVIMFLFVIFLGAILSNTYDSISGDAMFPNQDFPIMDWFMQNLALVILGFFATIGVALYAKNRSGGGF